MWSLAITIFEMVYTSKLPMFKLDQTQYYDRLCIKKELPEIPSHVSNKLRHMIGLCLVYDPEERGSAKDMIEFLELNPGNI